MIQNYGTWCTKIQARGWSVEATRSLKVELGVQLDVKERWMQTQAEQVLKGLVFSTQKSGTYYKKIHRGIFRGNKPPVLCLETCLEKLNLPTEPLKKLL